jgi:PTS system mannose-specific IID component
MKALTRATSILGLMMVGALVAQMVNVPLNWTITISGAKLVIQDVLNNIFPGMLSIGLVFGLVAMIKKGWRPLYLVFGILILGLLGALIHIF